MINKIKILFEEIFKPMPLENNFEDYDKYWQNRGFHAPSLNRAKIISKYIDPESKILDIGCGDGTVIEFLSKNNKPQKIMGIDISQRAVDYVNAMGYTAQTVDVFSNKFTDILKENEFDYIIVMEVLEHVQDPEIILTSIKNNFSKSLFVSIPNAGFFVNRARLIFGRFPLVLIQQHVKEHIRFWTLKDFIYWCDYLGFKVDDFFVSAGLNYKPLNFLEKIFPGLFGCQIIYKISIKNERSK